MSSVVQPELGLRERKRLATRRSICQAVLDLSAERSFDDLTIEDIAARADVSRRTFFNYFESKEEALLAIPMDWAAEVEQRLVAAPPEVPAWQAISEAVLHAAAACTATVDRHMMAWLMSIEQAAVGQERMRSFVEMEARLTANAAQRMGVDPAQDVAPHLLVGSAVTCLRVAVTVWTTSEPPADLVELTRQCLSASAGGLDGRTDRAD